jgi:hypothetical protein
MSNDIGTPRHTVQGVSQTGREIGGDRRLDTRVVADREVYGDGADRDRLAVTTQRYELHGEDEPAQVGRHYW